MPVIERVLFIENGSKALDGDWGIEDPGTATGGFLGAHRMGRWVGAEKKLRQSRSGGSTQGKPVSFIRNIADFV